MSALGLREAEVATGLPCLTARTLQSGKLSQDLARTYASPRVIGGRATLASSLDP